MNKYVWSAVMLAVLGLAVWNAVEGEWVWAAVDVAAFLLGFVGLKVLTEASQRVPVKLEPVKVEPSETLLPPMLRDEMWYQHLAECAMCRDFWKDDDGR